MNVIIYWLALENNCWLLLSILIINFLMYWWRKREGERELEEEGEEEREG